MPAFPWPVHCLQRRTTPAFASSQRRTRPPFASSQHRTMLVSASSQRRTTPAFASSQHRTMPIPGRRVWQWPLRTMPGLARRHRTMPPRPARWARRQTSLHTILRCARRRRRGRHRCRRHAGQGKDSGAGSSRRRPRSRQRIWWYREYGSAKSIDIDQRCVGVVRIQLHQGQKAPILDFDGVGVRGRPALAGCAVHQLGFDGVEIQRGDGVDCNGSLLDVHEGSLVLA